MTHCPTCNRKLDRSTALIPGLAVLACRGDGACRKYAVQPPEGIDWEWLDGGPDLIDRLLASYARANETVAIRQSEADDPRWTEMSSW